MTNPSTISRRNFTKLGLGAGLGWLGGLGHVTTARAAVDPGYRAIVCIFLAGGNDGHNTVIPIGANNLPVSEYSQTRSTIALPSTNAKTLLPINAGISTPHGSNFTCTPVSATSRACIT